MCRSAAKTSGSEGGRKRSGGLEHRCVSINSSFKLWSWVRVGVSKCRERIHMTVLGGSCICVFKSSTLECCKLFTEFMRNSWGMGLYPHLKTFVFVCWCLRKGMMLQRKTTTPLRPPSIYPSIHPAPEERTWAHLQTEQSDSSLLLGMVLFLTRTSLERRTKRSTSKSTKLEATNYAATGGKHNHRQHVSYLKPSSRQNWEYQHFLNTSDVIRCVYLL